MCLIIVYISRISVAKHKGAATYIGTLLSLLTMKYIIVFIVSYDKIIKEKELQILKLQL